MTITTPIIPIRQTFTGDRHTPDYRAICVFAALGFFLDDDTYFTGQKVLKPATNYQLQDGKITSAKPRFQWHYTPVERPLDKIVEEFAALFEQIVDEQTAGHKVILPLSGGLDSRTQAAALKHLNKNVSAYSYNFQGGHDETKYAQKIAQACGFPFQGWEVPQGYLWKVIDDLAKINGCYAEFTHPRQMAFAGRYKDLGAVFSLGHWGDVLFDDMGVDDSLSLDERVEVLLQKMVKKGGIELAKSLWKQWGLAGDFEMYLTERVSSLLRNINIPESANAQIRAFKSLYWAPRWTSINLAVFESDKPVTLPYYDNRMCEFICSVPEKYLAGRQIQIAYLKMRNPELAKIPWQSQRPFNLYNYHLNKVPYNLPYRVYNKLERSLKATLGQPYIQRNWELQFTGDENVKQLKKYLAADSMKEMVSPALTAAFLDKFLTKNALQYAHPVSMLLTLALWSQLRKG